MIGPAMNFYISALEQDLREHGYRQSLQLMSCAGGLIDADYARTAPVMTIGSGPVAGLIGAGMLASVTQVGGSRHVITADVGGTTLDIGTIWDATPVRRATASHGQYEYFAPTLDVRSVGAGGGSIIRVDGASMKVGPQSAGARPGPVCFGRGGQQPTVTDAAVVLGYLDPRYVFGGRLSLDLAPARSALERVGEPLGLNAEQTAAAAMRIVNSQMADAIWLTTTQQGYDARDFVLYSFGGAGGLDATALARELGIREVVVPLSNFAAGWSAFGIAASDALVPLSTAVGLSSPFDPKVINRHWRQLEAQAIERLIGQGVARSAVQLRHYAELRYALQVNEVLVEVEGGVYDEAAVSRMVAAFEVEYERLYGKGSGYAAAGFTLTGLQVHGRARLSDLQIDRIDSGESTPGDASSLKGSRDVVWYARGATPIATPVHDGARLATGVDLPGPAIIEYPDTTILVEHDSVAQVHASGSVVIELTEKTL